MYRKPVDSTSNEKRRHKWIVDKSVKFLHSKTWCYELVEEFGYFICWGCVRRKNGRGWYSTSSSFIYVQHNRRRKISRRPSDGQETKLAVSKHKLHSTSATTTVPTKVNPKFRRASEQLEP
ncbi:hypothetical protein L2E82_21844 [Cichorium intybus]|uniref:Uncharacterized protein n=1 Tax=Cichorium intybus TaxID=13427 RepID=A0ACB9DW18_CICIN|nr:hypothetical protein L2E82_21844 [Cichorium intybus]